jgi:hypothetical protein
MLWPFAAIPPCGSPAVPGFNVVPSIWPRATAIRCFRPMSPTRSSRTPNWCAITVSAGRSTGVIPRRPSSGAGTAGYYAARNSQDATAAYRPVFEGQRALQKRLGIEPVFATLEDFVERSSALIGSPQQVIDKVHRYHEQFGHTVLHLHADAGGLTDAQHRAAMELFQSDIAPVLRREIPDPPWSWGPVGQTAVPATV